MNHQDCTSWDRDGKPKVSKARSNGWVKSSRVGMAVPVWAFGQLQEPSWGKEGSPARASKPRESGHNFSGVAGVVHASPVDGNDLPGEKIRFGRNQERHGVSNVFGSTYAPNHATCSH